MSVFKSLKRTFRSVDEYVDTVVLALEDGRLTEQELRQLHSVAAKLDMTMEEREKAHVRAIEKLMTGFLADGYLDQHELQVFQNAMETLRVQQSSINPAVSQAVFNMLLLQQVAQGHLPVVHPTQALVPLAAGETAHLVTPCRIIEDKVVRRKYVGGYSGVSFRICKGVRYHIGGSRGVSLPVTAPVTVSQGNLILTSSREVYLGSTKGFNKPWGKVGAVEPFSNAGTFYFSDRQNATTLMYDHPSVAPFVEAICGHLLA